MILSKVVVKIELTNMKGLADFYFTKREQWILVCKHHYNNKNNSVANIHICN